ncbi:uncharacterized protein LOC62_04G006358 [Vanrija pseudolonga]|uniref:Ig-like domain-containing protein n=1 Tax=Vanrija pseudolonga TaxID=143232 RepID=A0AAF1BM05_9TREE|nr:hypothetical protein LOC62_04G006358 [Vanrija pseudolonga]
MAAANVLLAPVLALLALASSATAAGPYKIKSTSGARCRSAPFLNSPIVKTYAYGAPVTITCCSFGQVYSGSQLWDKTTDGCFVHDELVKTFTTNNVAPWCTGPAPSQAPCGPKSGRTCIVKDEVADQADQA